MAHPDFFLRHLLTCNIKFDHVFLYSLLYNTKRIEASQQPKNRVLLYCTPCVLYHDEMVPRLFLHVPFWAFVWIWINCNSVKSNLLKKEEDLVVFLLVSC